MDYKCPKRYECLEDRCAKHIYTRNFRDIPVSSPCLWYITYIKTEELKDERKIKINNVLRNTRKYI